MQVPKRLQLAIRQVLHHGKLRRFKKRRRRGAVLDGNRVILTARQGRLRGDAETQMAPGISTEGLDWDWLTYAGLNRLTEIQLW